MGTRSMRWVRFMTHIVGVPALLAWLLLQQLHVLQRGQLYLPVRNHRPRSRPTRAASVGAHANLASAGNGYVSATGSP